MKKQTLVAVSAGLMCVTLFAGTTVAGAATVRRSAQRHRAAAAPPSIKITPAANLVAGESVTVTGAGFPAEASLIIAECNADGDGPGPTKGSCDLSRSERGSVTTTAIGTFSTTFTIIVGTMKKEVPDNSCAQGDVQAEHSVQCVIAAADFKAKKLVYAPIFFAAPKLLITFTYPGVLPIEVTIRESGGYTSSAVGGFEIIGAVGEAEPPSRACQGSRNDSTVWTGSMSLGLPACTRQFGEHVRIKLLRGTQMKYEATVRVSTHHPGAFSYTFSVPNRDEYSVDVLGMTSGEELTGTALY
jgi:hypothetical protein